VRTSAAHALASPFDCRQLSRRVAEAAQRRRLPVEHRRRPRISQGPNFRLPSATPQPQAKVPPPCPSSNRPYGRFCANKAASLGGVNIAFPLESTLHIDDWFSDSPADVKCEDDVGNPRTCWGPESAVFEALWCNTDMVQGNDYACESLPVTLGSCSQERQNTREEDSRDPEPVPSCGHC
jgi:hypothetical protein